jgi:ComF family protein
MHWLENWLLPAKCVLSDTPGDGLDLSFETIEALKKPEKVCPQCCEFSEDSSLCGPCIATPPAYDRTQVGFYFEGDLLPLIHGLKYQNRVAYARLLAELLAPKLQNQKVEALIAVPLHIKRWRERGYNQAELIAESLAKELGLPVLKNSVERVKPTPSQTGLSKKLRQHNLAGAFRVNTTELEGYQSIALVDDVITTSSTMNALAKQIKKSSNINYIEAWAIAKTQ